MSEKYPEYNEEKTTQLAAYFLHLNGGHMQYLKLIKLLYFMDRTALDIWNEPLTFDRYVSMDNGPVLSITYDKIKAANTAISETYWNKFICKKRFELFLIKPGEKSKLSPAELELADDIYKKYGKLDQWYIVTEICHKLPEWKNPNNSSLPISMYEVLQALGKSEEEIKEIDENLKDQAYIDFLLG